MGNDLRVDGLALRQIGNGDRHRRAGELRQRQHGLVVGVHGFGLSSVCGNATMPMLVGASSPGQLRPLAGALSGEGFAG